MQFKYSFYWHYLKSASIPFRRPFIFCSSAEMKIFIYFSWWMIAIILIYRTFESRTSLFCRYWWNAITFEMKVVYVNWSSGWYEVFFLVLGTMHHYGTQGTIHKLFYRFMEKTNNMVICSYHPNYKGKNILKVILFHI